MRGRFAVSRIVPSKIVPLAVLAAWSFGVAPVHAGHADAGHAASAETSAHRHADDLLLLPAVTATHRTASPGDLRQDELMPELNVFYSTEHDRLRFLAEYLIDRDEHEMERLQVGWVVEPGQVVWLGRFHSPVGFWNSEHHHGAFMQTTISRPGIVAFEDEGGVLPTHVTGLLAEGALDREYGTLNYAVGIGQGPEFNSELVPVNIIEARNGGKFAANGRLSYRPFDEHRGEFGGFAAYSHIPVAGQATIEADQTLGGVFYNLQTDTLRLLGEFFYVSTRLKGTGVKDLAAFRAAYVQAEYRVHPDWTVFGRLEGTNGAKNNAYLDLNPEFMSERALAGARFEVGEHQALKLEISHNERQDEAHYNQFSLQWSMVYP